MQVHSYMKQKIVTGKSCWILNIQIHKRTKAIKLLQ